MRPVDRDRTLRAIAARLEKAAARARERGEAEAALDMQEAVVDLLVLGSPEEARLLSNRLTSTVNSGMDTLTQQHRINLSRTRRKTPNPFLDRARKKGYTLRSLAQAIGIGASMLSQARLDPKDSNFRTLSQAHRREVQKLIGWPASDWPDRP